MDNPLFDIHYGVMLAMRQHRNGFVAAQAPYVEAYKSFFREMRTYIPMPGWREKNDVSPLASSFVDQGIEDLLLRPTQKALAVQYTIDPTEASERFIGCGGPLSHEQYEALAMTFHSALPPYVYVQEPPAVIKTRRKA